MSSQGLSQWTSYEEAHKAVRRVKDRQDGIGALAHILQTKKQGITILREKFKKSAANLEQALQGCEEETEDVIIMGELHILMTSTVKQIEELSIPKLDCPPQEYARKAFIYLVEERSILRNYGTNF